MADPMKCELSLRLRSLRMEPGSRPIEAWNDVSYDELRVRAYKRWWKEDGGFTHPSAYFVKDMDNLSAGQISVHLSCCLFAVTLPQAVKLKKNVFGEKRRSPTVVCFWSGRYIQFDLKLLPSSISLSELDQSQRTAPLHNHNSFQNIP
ncbi:hypothetical protein CEXT_235291 [Caerostris extrusa]|uniref:Uncharacterized protein n=1 Tax=Caerostris extrusa TaxID=172846 RepID=A0AAV4Y8G3_CAEEX|nr:hypothetical protein CEXT_235291 [Caerostris extrusa]